MCFDIKVKKGISRTWLRLRPSEVRSAPSAKDTRCWSVSAARINVSSPIIPNWSVTIEGGMLVTVPSGNVWIPRCKDNDNFNINEIFAIVYMAIGNYIDRGKALSLRSPGSLQGLYLTPGKS